MGINEDYYQCNGEKCLSSRRPNVAAYMENEKNYRLITENMTDMVAVNKKLFWIETTQAINSNQISYQVCLFMFKDC